MNPRTRFIFFSVCFYTTSLLGISSSAVAASFFSLWTDEPKGDTVDIHYVKAHNTPIQWKRAFPKNMVFTPLTGGLTPLHRTGWHNGAEGLPIRGDFHLEYTFRIGTCFGIGKGDFLLGYTKVDPDSSNIVNHGWQEDGNAVFLLFDQGCEMQSLFGIPWETFVFECTSIGDTIAFHIMREDSVARFEIYHREKIYTGSIDSHYSGDIWPVAAFFQEGTVLISAKMVSGEYREIIYWHAQKVWFLFISVLLAGVTVMWYRTRSQYHASRNMHLQTVQRNEMAMAAIKAVEQERIRIASEMHDDLGAGLTTIQYLSDKAIRSSAGEEETVRIKKIAEQSKQLLRNMSEITWAMNSRFDNAESLFSYLRRYGAEFLGEHGIAVTIEEPPESTNPIELSAEKRRNVFLVYKEVLHNTVKHADVREVNIAMSSINGVEVRIEEKGSKGFDIESSLEKGNGLYNSARRMEKIGGRISYVRQSQSMEIILQLPVQNWTGAADHSEN